MNLNIYLKTFYFLYIYVPYLCSTILRIWCVTMSVSILVSMLYRSSCYFTFLLFTLKGEKINYKSMEMNEQAEVETKQGSMW